MRWRRGLILAIIHLALAAPLVIHHEMQGWKYLLKNPLSPSEVAAGKTAGWDACVNVDYWPTPNNKLVKVANFPAAMFTAWNIPCPAYNTLAAAAARTFGEQTRKAEVLLVSAFFLLIALQWFVLGSFPVVHPRRAWLEPGFFITCCAVIGHAVALVAPETFSLAPLLLIFIAWLVWIVLIFVKLLRKLWRSVLPERVAAA